MKHTFYTSYLSKLNDDSLPKDAIKIVIMRFPLFVPKRDDIIICTELGPDLELFQEYKRTKDWYKFETGFIEQIKNNKDTNMYMQYTLDALENYNDVIYLCKDKENRFCHRGIWGRYYESLGYKWEEIV